MYRTVEKGGRGGKRSRACTPKGPVNTLRRKFCYCYTSLQCIYGNSSALKGYLQKASTLMTVLMSETKPPY